MAQRYSRPAIRQNSATRAPFWLRRQTAVLRSGYVRKRYCDCAGKFADCRRRAYA